jgi:hypothetical protein
VKERKRERKKFQSYNCACNKHLTFVIGKQKALKTIHKPDMDRCIHENVLHDLKIAL